MVTTLEKAVLKNDEESINPIEEKMVDLINIALKAAQAKLSLALRKNDLGELFQRHDFMNWFKYNLSENISEILSENDKKILEIHLFEPSANPDAESGEYLPMDASLHLLVLVEATSAGLTALIASLDRALVKFIKDLPSPLFTNLTSMLDVIPVTKEDVENRTGYAALLTSIYAPPLKIWHRE